MRVLGMVEWETVGLGIRLVKDWMGVGMGLEQGPEGMRTEKGPGGGGGGDKMGDGVIWEEMESGIG